MSVSKSLQECPLAFRSKGTAGETLWTSVPPRSTSSTPRMAALPSSFFPCASSSNSSLRPKSSTPNSRRVPPPRPRQTRTRSKRSCSTTSSSKSSSAKRVANRLSSSLSIITIYVLKWSRPKSCSRPTKWWSSSNLWRSSRQACRFSTTPSANAPRSSTTRWRPNRKGCSPTPTRWCPSTNRWTTASSWGKIKFAWKKWRIWSNRAIGKFSKCLPRRSRSESTNSSRICSPWLKCKRWGPNAWPQPIDRKSNSSPPHSNMIQKAMISSIGKLILPQPKSSKNLIATCHNLCSSKSRSIRLLTKSLTPKLTSFTSIRIQLYRTNRMNSIK